MTMIIIVRSYLHPNGVGERRRGARRGRLCAAIFATLRKGPHPRVHPARDSWVTITILALQRACRAACRSPDMLYFIHNTAVAQKREYIAVTRPRPFRREGNETDLSARRRMRSKSLGPEFCQRSFRLAIASERPRFGLYRGCLLIMSKARSLGMLVIEQNVVLLISRHCLVCISFF